jgi:hypothetical protein
MAQFSDETAAARGEWPSDTAGLYFLAYRKQHIRETGHSSIYLKWGMLSQKYWIKKEVLRSNVRKNGREI